MSGLFQCGVVRTGTNMPERDAADMRDAVRCALRAETNMAAAARAAHAFDRMVVEDIQLMENTQKTKCMWAVPLLGADPLRPVMAPLLDVPLTDLRRWVRVCVRELTQLAAGDGLPADGPDVVALHCDLADAEAEDPKQWGGVRGRAAWRVDRARWLAQCSAVFPSSHLRACALLLLVGVHAEMWVREVERCLEHAHWA